MYAFCIIFCRNYQKIRSLSTKDNKTSFIMNEISSRSFARHVQIRILYNQPNKKDSVKMKLFFFPFFSRLDSSAQAERRNYWDFTNDVFFYYYYLFVENVCNFIAVIENGRYFIYIYYITVRYFPYSKIIFWIVVSTWYHIRACTIRIDGTHALRSPNLVVGKLFGLSGHIYELKRVREPDKNENVLFLNYLNVKKNTI